MPNVIVSESVYRTVQLFYRLREIEITSNEKEVCKRLMRSWSHDVSMDLAEYNGLITVFTTFNHELLLREAQNNVSTN